MVLYTKKNCPQCQVVHILLDRKNVKYDECQDVDWMIENGITQTPSLKTDDGKLLVGKEVLDYVKGLN